MKSPEKLAAKLARQWHDAATRENRLLSPEAWPIKLSIGRPGPELIDNDPAGIRTHLERWRAVNVGKVSWIASGYRATSEALEIPRYWQLDSPSQWVEACNDKSISNEYKRLGRIVNAIDPMFHRLVVRQRSQVMTRSPEEVIKAAEVAMLLGPGCAGGLPLRAYSVGGCDSKFFERNRSLLQQMLIERFGESAQNYTLEQFLGAQETGDHWLLVVPLEKGLLAFDQQRIRASELANNLLPGTHLLVVENERCLYLLPTLPGTVAVLGSGLNLNWMGAAWLQQRRVAYWGDIDTWGLLMLARARAACPTLQPLMMDMETFGQNAPDSAVFEPETAGDQIPEELNSSEQSLYRYLLSQERGRLEQEFIPKTAVRSSIQNWFSRA
ncbi:MAG: hypothetical protein GY875_20390 [Gammaproteobacteria bacterium]|nr:hypothetical protein [Gammaproteobacteria bacterium]